MIWTYTVNLGHDGFKGSGFWMDLDALWELASKNWLNIFLLLFVFEKTDHMVFWLKFCNVISIREWFKVRLYSTYILYLQNFSYKSKKQTKTERVKCGVKLGRWEGNEKIGN